MKLRSKQFPRLRKARTKLNGNQHRDNESLSSDPYAEVESNCFAYD